MKIYVDSADLDEVTAAFKLDFMAGVTTNPSLMKKYLDKHPGEDIESYLTKILETAGEGKFVSLEVIADTYKAMVKQGLFLFEKFNPVANNVLIKIPVCTVLDENKTEHFIDGLKAIQYLSKKNIPVNTTLCMSVSQAVLAAQSGAATISPFAGRTDDYLRKEKLKLAEFDKTAHYPRDGTPLDNGEIANDNGVVSGVHLCTLIKEEYEKLGLKTAVLAASLRNAEQVVEVDKYSHSDLATLPFPVVEALVADGTTFEDSDVEVGVQPVTLNLEEVKWEDLYHTKTVQGMVSFTNDIVPEWAAYLEAADTIEI